MPQNQNCKFPQTHLVGMAAMIGWVVLVILNFEFQCQNSPKHAFQTAPRTRCHFKGQNSPKHAFQTAPRTRCHFKGQNPVEKKQLVSKCVSKCRGAKWKCDVKQCGAKMWRQTQMWWRLRNDGNVASNNAASKCGIRHKCGGASEIMEMWRQTMWRQNVASGTNVVAPPKSWKCGVKQCGVKMWPFLNIQYIYLCNQ